MPDGSVWRIDIATLVAARALRAVGRSSNITEILEGFDRSTRRLRPLRSVSQAGERLAHGVDLKSAPVGSAALGQWVDTFMGHLRHRDSLRYVWCRFAGPGAPEPHGVRGARFPAVIGRRRLGSFLAVLAVR
jgi:hypothetical protein